MTSLETLLAAANFVEANDGPGSSAHGLCCYFDLIACFAIIASFKRLCKTQSCCRCTFMPTIFRSKEGLLF